MRETTNERLEAVLRDATGIAWDGCHKVYILLGEEQFQRQQSYGYGDGGSILIRLEGEEDRKEALGTIRGWYDESCSLRFISIVTGEDHDGYSSVLAQFEEWVERPPSCICDGGAYGVVDHPFLVHPGCALHGTGVRS